MSSLIQKFCKLFTKHLSGKDLMLLLGDEVSLSERDNAEKHLAGCRRCHARYEQLNQAAMSVTAYCDARAEAYIPRSRAQRDLLVVRLSQFFNAAVAHSRPAQRDQKSSRIAFSNMNPTFTTAMILAFASVVCIFVWLQQGRSSITSNTLLVRAEAWDAASSKPDAGVIYQRIGIKTPKQRVYRAIYRDARGQRQPRLQKLAYEDEQLKGTLASVGIMWDSPLSATAYQDWHDCQRVRQDRIRKSGQNLILTTTVPDGFVAEQSLTVRDSDFHPIQRTVVLRDRGTIEIAELEYHVLPWAEVGADMFEPVGVLRPDSPIRFQPALVPSLPSTLTDAQIDEAELSVRLVLNKLHADTGEQIRVVRESQGVRVKGLVETDRRKAELQEQLHMLSHVSVSILSIEELERHPDSESGIVSQQIASGTAQASPLEIYFIAHGHSVSTLSHLSQQLMDSALTVDQESRAITDLQVRFGSPEKITDLTAAALSELVFSHRERLFLALQSEQELLGETGLVSNIKSSGISSNGAVPLVSAAERNLALCKALTLGGSSPSRSAESIIAEMAASLNEVRASAHEMKLMRQSAAVSNEKK